MQFVYKKISFVKIVNYAILQKKKVDKCAPRGYNGLAGEGKDTDTGSAHRGEGQRSI